MAEKCKVPLLEVELPNKVSFTPFLSCARTASPVLHFSAFATEPLFLRLSEQVGASSIFTGELGDSIFGHAYDQELLAEALWRYRFSRSALRVLHSYAILYRISIWRAARLAISEYRLYRRPQSSGMYQRLVDRGFSQEHCLASDEATMLYLEMQSRFTHPWFRDISKGPPGWLAAVPGMIMLTSTWAHSGFSAASDVLFLSPLASQPLCEAFLAIPGDFNIESSQSAAIARRAFAPQLSHAVLDRGKGKGAPDLWLTDVIAQNRPFLRELLLDGLLVRNGVLDKRKTEAALSDDINRSKALVSDIIVQLYIESWLRQWTPYTKIGTLSDFAVP